MLRISGGYLAVIADWLVQQGHGASPLCARIRRLRADEYVSPDDAEHLLAQAAALTGDRHAALRIGQSVQWRHLGALGHVLSGSRTLEDLLNGYVYYESLFYGVNMANLQRDADGVTLYWRVENAWQEFARFSLSSVVAVIQACGIPHACITRIQVPAGEGVDAGTCTSILGCHNIRFTPAIGVTAPRSALGRGLRLRTGEAERAERIAMLFPELDDAALASGLFDAIASALPQRKAALPHVAAQLVMSERTLQRRLAVIPDGLRGAVGRVRMHLAEEYLQDPTLKLLAVSMLLGYSEQSAFQLAFRKHHGCAPGRWRRRNAS